MVDPIVPDADRASGMDLAKKLQALSDKWIPEGRRGAFMTDLAFLVTTAIQSGRAAAQGAGGIVMCGRCNKVVHECVRAPERNEEMADYWIYPGERRPVVVTASSQKEADQKVRLSREYDGFGGRVYPIEEYMKTCEPTIHSLKSWPEYYRPVVGGAKTFEVRVGNDRVYRVGDFIDMIEIDKTTRVPTGSHAVREITYVMHGPPFLPDDVWVLGIKTPDLTKLGPDPK